MTGKSDLSGIGNAKGIWIGRQGREISKRAFRGEGYKFCAKAIFHQSEQPAILGPAKIKNRPVHAGAAQILSRLFAVPGEDEVMRRWTVFTAADERHPFAVRREPDIVKGPTRRKSLRHGISCLAVVNGSIRKTKGKNAFGVLIGFRVICGA